MQMQGTKGLGRNQKNLYGFFVRHPNTWHSIGGDVVTQRILNDLISRKLVKANEHKQYALVVYPDGQETIPETNKE